MRTYKIYVATFLIGGIALTSCNNDTPDSSIQMETTIAAPKNENDN